MPDYPIAAHVFASAVAFLGRTGAGKTFAAKGAVERLLAEGARVCIVDPTGAWWGLRVRADGARSVFAPVIFGGDHADVAIGDDAGERLGALIAAGKARASIIDVSDFTGGQTTRFLTDFFEELYRANRTPLHLVMDEADVMAPQQPLPEQQRLKGAVNKLVRRGRIRGVRPMMITQRPAVIDKSVLSQISTLVAMRLTAPQDRKAIEDWVKGNADAGRAREVLDTLPALAIGEGFVWSPADDVLERVRFPAITTFDSSRAPEEGDAIAEPGELADVDLGELRAALATEQAFPVSLPKCANSQVDAKAIAAAEQRGYERGFSEGVATGRQQTVALIRSATDALESTLKRIETGDVPAPFAPYERPELLAAVAAAAPRPKPKKAIFRQPAESGALNSAGRKMLAVLDTNPPVRRTWQQAATLAGIKARGGHFNAGKKALVEAALVVEDGGLIRVAAPSGGAPPRSCCP